ncbi:DUF4436 family protein [Enterobacter kobei]|uniref:DUF4436 family protein n=1 Tax=Enterobacter kobei TaxID=208224 RepID=UPI002A80CDD1|nr:DUF4436 family protein [Enterobacter kobei]
MLLVIVLGLPFALKSLYNEVVGNASQEDTFMLINSGKSSNFTQVELRTTEINPVDGTLKMTVSGYHNCKSACDTQTIRLHISNFYTNNKNEKRVPESVVVAVPAGNKEFEQEITLGITGDVSRYPFDQYTLNLAVAVEKIDNGQSHFLDQNSAAVNIFIDEQIPRLHNVALKLVDNISSLNTEHPSVAAFSASLERPFYIKYIVSLLVILLVNTTAATILLTEFAALITGAAGIILGVWGARSLLIGDLPPDVTIIDIILTLIVLGTLVSVAVKSVIHANQILCR